MNEVVEVDVSSTIDQTLDMVELGDAREETKQTNPVVVTVDSHMQFGTWG